MKARRIPWWVYVVAIVLGVIVGSVFSYLEDHSDYGFMGAPWFISAIMILLGFVELYLAVQIHKYANTDPHKRAQLKPLEPQRAVRTLIFAKALAIAGAFLFGCYGMQIIMSIDHVEAAYYKDIVFECSLAAAASLFDCIAGAVGEWLCQLPPMDGPESQSIKRRNTQPNVFA